MSDTVVIDGVCELDIPIEGECGTFYAVNPTSEALIATENGHYKPTADYFSEVTVDVPLDAIPLTVTANGVYTREGGYNPVTVEIPEYEGAYTVTPTTEVQTLPTAGKVMEQDVTVEATDLYGLWTDIIGLYAGRNSSALAPFTPNSQLNKTTGELTAGENGVLETYLRVKPEYRYQKNGFRIYGICYYDKDKRYISWGNVKNNLTYGVRLDPFPDGTEYIRVITHNVTSNWALQIIRIE